MKPFTALSLLATVVSAQTSSFAFDNTESLILEPTEVPTPTSIGNIEVEPTTIEPISGPIETSKACGQIADAISDNSAELPVVEAALAIACLKSLPFYATDASTTVDEIKKMVEFQSTLAYLKDPPQGYPNPAIDIISGLDGIKSNAESGGSTVKKLLSFWQKRQNTRYNAMLFMPAAESYGSFINPRFFPGATTNITYQNGTTDEYRNVAIVADAEAWSRVRDADSFYNTFCIPTTSSGGGVKKRDMNDPPLQLKNPRERDFKSASMQQYGSVPLFYPEPFIAHTEENVPLAGYFINTDVGQIGVLIIQTFNTADVRGAREFQRVIQEYISQSKSRGVEKHIIDIRGNPGGKVLSGYDAYLQFFPSQVPQTQSRYRGHAASELFGESISSFEEITLGNGQFFTSPFSNDAYLSASLEEFPDWASMYPPLRFKGDNFTSLLKYNLSDPLTTSSTRLAVGITMTGYNDRSNFTNDPFRAEDLVILSDGICASTCAVFLELMVQQSGVRSIALGGRPLAGPMVSVGGTKGTLVLPSIYMEAISLFVALQFADSRSELAEWSSFLPVQPPIAVLDAGVNFQDNIRAGLESGGVPTQFLNDSASCRVWYEARDYLNVTGLWEKAARVAFGGKGGALDEARCVVGSVTSREQQTGKGEGNPSAEVGDGSKGGDDEDAASGVRVAWMTMVVCTSAVALSLLLV
ncbi:hypothetical protein GGP41_007181 [Bipolaris sorokiniana]|uniref:Tail specific protease domain-containing protein n=1 Tax=Cochliobolus sativus TaxID=45130 RepID=A0A8H6E185_COCSA|nr:hypothetical protein GGP41_007181 [Bipolaris sorokiniana]